MRLVPALVAASAVLALSAPLAQAADLELLLNDVASTHNATIPALEGARDKVVSAETAGQRILAEQEYRELLKQWREELLAASDEVALIREEALKAGTLTAEDEAALEELEALIDADRKLVRGLRSEVLPADETYVLPAPLLQVGAVSEVAVDAVERSGQGDKRVVFGYGPAEAGAAPAGAAPAAVAEPRAEVNPQARRQAHAEPIVLAQDNTTTVTSTATTSGTATTTATTTSETTTSTTTGTTTSETTTSMLENRTTSATTTTPTTTTSSSTTSTTTSRTSTPTTTTEEEREDDLAETGTPMLSVIALAALLIAGGVFLVRREN